MSKKKIMVVEDEAVVAADIRMSLEQLDYDVPAVVSDGYGAIREAADRKPDLVLMDIMLEGDMDGIEAAEHIQNVLGIPIVYLTAHGDADTLRKAGTSQPYGYLLKPFDIRTLAPTIEMALYKHEVDRKLRESEEKLKQLTREQEIVLENSSMGIAFLKERKFSWVNGKFAEILGCTKEELAGKDSRLMYSSPEEYERVGREVYPHLARADVYEGEAMLKRKDGTLLRGRLCGKVIDQSDPSAGSIWIAEDITERKKIEEERERMLVQQSKMAAMGEMIGAIGHQWRQPLNTLGLVVQGLKNSYDDGELDDETLSQAVKETMAQVTFMSKTIDDFRNFTNPEKRKEAFDLKVAVGEIFALLSAQMKVNAVRYALTCYVHNRITTSFEEVKTCGEFEITSYRNEFKQVILNLIGNAKDAILERRGKGLMPPGEEGRIDAGFYRRGNIIMITITDNGGGIPEENMDKIFDPYFTTKKDGKGTGIGLYIAKTIIEKNMGGRLYAANKGNGMQFTIEFPC